MESSAARKYLFTYLNGALSFSIIYAAILHLPRGTPLQVAIFIWWLIIGALWAAVTIALLKGSPAKSALQRVAACASIVTVAAGLIFRAAA